MLHGGDRESLNMRGAILHVLGDLLGSVAAIVAAAGHPGDGLDADRSDPVGAGGGAAFLHRLVADAESAHLLLEGVPRNLDRDGIARDIAGNVPGVREIHHMHVWSLDGTKNMATLHACLADGTDALAAVRAIKVRLARRHGIEHATVEPEFGQCADPQPTQH